MGIRRRRIERIVLAFSGDLQTSVAIPWLEETFGAEVVTVTLDVGQGRELADVRDRALAIGATRAHVLDAREEFANDFVLPALQVRALNDGRDPLGDALARPLVAKHLAAIAQIEETGVVAHGSGDGGDSRTQLEDALRSLDGSVEILAPARMWSMSAEDLVEYARQRGIPVAPGSDYAVNANLWARTVTLANRAGASDQVDESVYLLTKSAAEAPDIPALLRIEFDRGKPTRINGVSMAFAELILSLQTIAGAHGVGRIHSRQGRLVEAPAATVLRLAYDALVQCVEEPVTGTVLLKLHKGTCHIAGVGTKSSSESAEAAVASAAS